MTGTQVPVAHRDSPYFGLDYYDEKFGAWFFGREADGGKIITNLRAARLTLLHAESGVGKTSLLRAGVAWRLHRLADDMLARGRPVRSIPVVFSSWKDDPVTELATAVGAAIRPYLGNGGMLVQAGIPLVAVVEAASSAVNASLCIMLDQFEEYFLYRSREPVPERFADELACCVNRTGLRANFLIAIREDAYAELGDLFKGRITNVYGNYLHIDYLDRASAEKAIRGPIEVYNSQPGVDQQVTVQDELVEAVLDEVRTWEGPVPTANGGRDHIATPLLQLVMQRLWDTERAEGSRQLRLSTLQRLRGVRMIVDDHLGKALGSLSSAEREAAVDMFDHLVTPSGGKIAESVSDLAKRTGHAETQVDGVLRKLDDERILRPVPAAPGQDPVRSRRYEIFHDVLASPINRAIAAREEQRRVRRIRRLAALAVAALVVVSAVAVVFAYLLNSANSEKLTAESRELAADADLDVARDPELSTSLALQALKLSPTSQAADALRAALPELQALRTFRAGPAVSSAAFDPADPNIVASADNSGVVWLWNIRTGRHVERVLGNTSDLSAGATAMAFNSGGTKMAVGYGTGTVDVFDVRSGTLQDTFLNFETGVSGLQFAADQNELAVAAGSLEVWAYQTDGYPQCCYSPNLPTQGTAVSADPRNPDEFALTTGTGVVIVNTRNPDFPTHYQLGRQQASDAQFSPDGNEIVTAAADGQVTIYRLTTRSVVTTFSVGGTAATTAAFSPDGKQIVAGYQDGTGRVWDIAARRQLTLLVGHSGPITSAQFSPDGREVVTASQDGTIRVSYTEPRELQTEITIPPAGSTPVTMARAQYGSGRILAADGTGDVFVYTTIGRREADITRGLAARTVAWNRTGTKIATLDPDGTVELWHAVGSNYTQVSPAAAISLSLDLSQVSMAMSPDGSRLAVGTGGDYSFNSSSDSYGIQVLSTNTGEPLQTLEAVNPVQILTFSADGRQIAATDSTGQVEIWQGAATDPQILGGPGPGLNDVSFNRSGSELVTASASGVVTVWDTRTGRMLRQIGTCASPNSAAFSPDGSKIVAACPDGTAPVFDAATGRTLTVIQAFDGSSASDAEFSPDGKSIITAANGAIQIWNAELATPSLPALEGIARQRVGDELSAAQLQQYLSGTSS